jgi:hypothetical protein
VACVPQKLQVTTTLPVYTQLGLDAALVFPPAGNGRARAPPLSNNGGARARDSPGRWWLERTGEQYAGPH